MTILARRGGMAVGLFAGALALRAIGLGYGLPDVYNPDEVAIMARALSFAKGTLNPHNFLYPTFYFYVLFAVVALYLGGVWVTGGVSSVAALQTLYFTNPSGIYLAGRLLSAVSGAGSVLVVRALGARLFDMRIGTAAAILLAVAPLHVRDSHYVKHDVFATLLVVIAYVMLVRMWDSPPEERRRAVVAASVACGAAFSTHYYCIFLALPLTWAILQPASRSPHAAFRHASAREAWRDRLFDLALAAVVSAVTFFALSPFILAEPARAIQDITANREIVIDRAVATGAFAPTLRYVDMLWNDAMGRVVILLGGVGVAWMLVADWRRAVLLLAFPVPFFVFITNTFPASRYLNPILPFVALFAAYALNGIVRRVTERPVVFWGMVALIALPPAAASLRTVLFIREADTRTLAREWIESHVPPSATVLVQPYSVNLVPSRDGLVEALERNLGNVSEASTKFKIQLDLNPYPAPAYHLIYLGKGGLDADKIYVSPDDLNAADGVDRLRSSGVAFVVLKRYNSVDSELKTFLAALAHRGRQVARFSPFHKGATLDRQAWIDPFLHNTDARIDAALERPGPVIEIWQLDGTGS